jgi:hypothetical protein
LLNEEEMTKLGYEKWERIVWARQLRGDQAKWNNVPDKSWDVIDDNETMLIGDKVFRRLYRRQA